MTVVDESTLPWPGDELVYRVTGGTDREGFYSSGRDSVIDLNAALAVVGTRLEHYSSILDFGCGCGRILMWLRQLAEGATLHGVDIDERAVSWAADNLPWARLTVNQPNPPLDYPDGHFDLVFNHSVFTHIDEALQDDWLEELRRVTKVGGHVLLTVHGEWAFSEYESNVARAGGDASRSREILERDGIYFLREDANVGGPFPDYYHTTFHAPWYVFSHWGRYFTVKGYLPRRSLNFQDFVVLERTTERPDERPVPPPIEARRQVDDAPPEAPGIPPVSEPTDRAHALLARGPDVRSRSRWGPAATVARRAVNRLLRHHDDHQRQVFQALVDAVRYLEARLGSDIPAQLREVKQINLNLLDVVCRQAERVNRMEADLWAEVRDLRRRGGEGERQQGSAGP